MSRYQVYAYEDMGSERTTMLQPNNCQSHDANLGPSDAKICSCNHYII